MRYVIDRASWRPVPSQAGTKESLPNPPLAEKRHKNHLPMQSGLRLPGFVYACSGNENRKVKFIIGGRNSKCYHRMDG